MSNPNGQVSTPRNSPMHQSSGSQASSNGSSNGSSSGSSNGSHKHDSQPQQSPSNGPPGRDGEVNGAQHQEPPAGLPPYRGVAGYYAYGPFPGMQYDPAVQDQYLYQYNYNGLHPYWRNAYMSDERDSWDEHNQNE